MLKKSGLLLFLFCFLGCTNISQEDSSKNYPEQFTSEFMTGCLEEAEESDRIRVEKACSCLAKKLQARYTYRELQEITKEINTTGNIPSDYRQIVNDCTLG